jgi:RNA polymerase sigma-70 factor (ECF subfamily)
MTGSPEDAQDMSQEAFIKAYNRCPSFRGDSKFSVWLYRIVSNVCVDFLRSQEQKSARRIPECGPDDGEDDELDIPDCAVCRRRSWSARSPAAPCADGLLSAAAGSAADTAAA